MSDWQQVLNQVTQQQRAWAKRGCDFAFYRGHRLTNWQLKCALGRGSMSSGRSATEAVVYYDFLSLGGPLLSRDSNSWDVAFAMQHHGLPTRLLDWSTNFAVALYFAVSPHLAKPRTPAKSACIWMLNPFALNDDLSDGAGIINPTIDLDAGYHDYFISNNKKLASSVIAINPNRSSSRQSAQRSAFTLHRDIWQPLEVLAPKHIRKIDIPRSCFPKAAEFLNLAGINEYTLFPDLDGLARQLRREHASHL